MWVFACVYAHVCGVITITQICNSISCSIIRQKVGLLYLDSDLYTSDDMVNISGYTVSDSVFPTLCIVAYPQLGITLVYDISQAAWLFKQFPCIPFQPFFYDITISGRVDAAQAVLLSSQCHGGVGSAGPTESPLASCMAALVRPSYIYWSRPGHHDDKVKRDRKNSQSHSLNVPLSFRSDRVEACRKRSRPLNCTQTGSIDGVMPSW